MVYAAGTVILNEYRELKKLDAVKIGNAKAHQVTKRVVESMLNEGKMKVVAEFTQDGKRKFNAQGLPVYKLKFASLDTAGFEIVKIPNLQDKRKPLFKLHALKHDKLHDKFHPRRGSVKRCNSNVAGRPTHNLLGDESLSATPRGNAPIPALDTAEVSRAAASNAAAPEPAPSLAATPKGGTAPSNVALAAQIDALTKQYQENLAALTSQMTNGAAASAAGGTPLPSAARYVNSMEA